MTTEAKISGFTMVRNAIHLDYPLVESIRSALPLVDEFILNCGDSQDGTRELCERIAAESDGKVRVVHSAWQKEAQTGGFQLKAQTDRALAECRNPWCLYIQADEVLHEADYARIQAALESAAPRADVDGVLFEYLHFYGNFRHHIVGRNWYRREVRLFKNRPGISAFRDAQGFRKSGQRLRAISSGARVFHYGYVRSIESLRRKSQEMAKWWGETSTGSDESLEFRKHIGLRVYTGTHPRMMSERVSMNAQYVDPSQGKRYWNSDEIKNAVTLVWERIFPFRIGEFRNYDLVKP